MFGVVQSSPKMKEVFGRFSLGFPLLPTGKLAENKGVQMTFGHNWLCGFRPLSFVFVVRNKIKIPPQWLKGFQMPSQKLLWRGVGNSQEDGYHF
jgi:hypothetical protein